MEKLVPSSIMGPAAQSNRELVGGLSQKGHLKGQRDPR